MDIREIQALHAKYTAHPVVIDISSHTAAMASLPAPARALPFVSRGRSFANMLSRAGRPAMIAIAVGVVAAAGGMSAARIWQAMHETALVGPRIHTSTLAAPMSVRKQLSAEVPNAVSARPLTTGDLENTASGGSAGLSRVEPQAIAAPAPASPAMTNSSGQQDTTAQAAASPIHATRAAKPTTMQQQVESSPPAQASLPSPDPATMAHPTPSAPAANPAIHEIKPTAQRHTVRPLARVKPQQEPNAPAEAETQSPSPAQPKVLSSKSGDVPLF